MSSPGTQSTRPGKPVALSPVRPAVGIALAVCFVAGNPGPSAARDLTAVSAFVIPAYTAMNFATICAQESSWAGSQPRGPRGVAVQYAEHVKDEAIRLLSYEEAVIVLRMAADAARSRARDELRKLSSSGMSEDFLQLAAWCSGYAREFISAFMHEHDNGHDRLMEHLDNVKR